MMSGLMSAFLTETKRLSSNKTAHHQRFRFASRRRYSKEQQCEPGRRKLPPRPSKWALEAAIQPLRFHLEP
jgi:hypothetical protein